MWGIFRCSLVMGLMLVTLMQLAPVSVRAAGNIKLPTPNNVPVSVGQGNNQGPSHFGPAAWAFDFSVATGTEVYASRAGYVRLTKWDSNTGGCNTTFNPFANYIIINHQDGTESLYLHLQQDGVVVSEGQFVMQGAFIGRSGSAGYACGPHLHFQVQVYGATRTQYLTQSIPVVFADHGNPPSEHGVPVLNSTVRARHYDLDAAKWWYFAEGYTGTGSDEYLTIQNPNSLTTAITITYYPTGMAPVVKTLSVPANSRTTINVHDAGHPQGLGRLSVGHATKVESNLSVIVERPMYFIYYGGGWDGGHNADNATTRSD